MTVYFYVLKCWRQIPRLLAQESNRLLKSHSETERMSTVVHHNEHLYRPYAFSFLEIIFDYLA